MKTERSSCDTYSDDALHWKATVHGGLCPDVGLGNLTRGRGSRAYLRRVLRDVHDSICDNECLGRLVKEGSLHTAASFNRTCLSYRLRSYDPHAQHCAQLLFSTICKKGGVGVHVHEHTSL